MIHSLSGGKLTKNQSHTFVKVKLNNNTILWYICDDFDVNVGDNVLVPLGNAFEQAIVEKVEKNIPSQNFPIPTKNLKHIECKIKEAN